MHCFSYWRVLNERSIDRDDGDLGPRVGADFVDAARERVRVRW
jgi:hypothetical protein